MFRIVKPVTSPDEFRERIRVKIQQIFESVEQVPNDTVKISKHIERGMFNTTLSMASHKKVVKKWDNPSFVNLYITKFRSIYYHLTEYPFVVQNIVSGEWKARDLAHMSAQELNPSRWNALIQSKLERDKSLFHEDFQAATDQFTCFKCKKKKCVFYELQTSSGDESTTIFITCLSCGNRWKTR